MSIYPVSLFVTPDGLRIERYEEAFRTDVDSMIVDLGEVRSMKVSPAGDWMFGQMTVGSADKDYQSANGRFEFNTENVFHLPVRKYGREQKYIGKYRTDSFGVTDTRLTFERKSTTTGDADNDVFFIHAVEKLISGDSILVPYDAHTIHGDDRQRGRSGIFNVWLSPKRCLMRHGRILAGILQGTDGRLRYSSTGKTDAHLVSWLPGDDKEIEERKDYDVSDVSPVWLPEIYDVDSKVPYDLVSLIEAKIGGYVQFSFRGKIYRGFPVDVRQEHWKNPGQTLKLLLVDY